MVKSTNTLQTEYYGVQNEYQQKYGNKVAVFMNVGKFYEMYAPPDDTASSNINMREICSLLNCKVTWKDSSRMSGFPIPSLDKNVKKLIENDYTVIVLDQMPPETGEKRLTRRVVRVVSKGTDAENERLRNNIMSIYYRKFAKSLYTFGIAVIDTLISKQIVVHEIQSTVNDNGFALDSAIKFVAQYDPVECIITTQQGDCATNIRRHLGLHCSVFLRDIQDIDEDILQQLETYPDSIMYAVGSLKMFLHDHAVSVDQSIVNYQPETHLDLCSTAIKQLDIPLLLNKSYGINQTVTPMGNRLLTERLYSPSTQFEEIQKRYDAIERMDLQQCQLIRNVLRDIPDISRLHQWLSYGRLSWYQFKTLYESYNRALQILQPNTQVATQSIIDYCSKIVNIVAEPCTNGSADANNDQGSLEGEELESNANRSELGRHENIFCVGIYPDLDDAFDKIKESEKCVQKVISLARSTIPKCDTFKIKDRTGLVTTHARANKLKSTLHMKVLQVRNSSIVYTEELRDALILLSDIQEEIEKMTNKYLVAFQINLHQFFETTLGELVQELAEIDVVQCSFTIAKRLRLNQPKLKCGTGLVRIKQLRHLLIETINQQVRYVPNDCELEYGGTTQGMVLYGVNSCGKTSYLKSLGLAIVMAQAGLYVPAESMEYSPFSRIMTRIAGTDNMERSQSSYIVELEELLSMIQRCDDKTLVLGDEMCRGTEVASANAMVYSTLEHLLEKKTLFVAATHLHGIADKVEQNLKKVGIFHMEVTFDSDQNAIYDRKLKIGIGSNLYGLEIAKSMRFPKDFIARAIRFRSNELEEAKFTRPPLQTQNTGYKRDSEIPRCTIRKSRYNAKKTLQKCECCGYKPTDSRSLPLDTHHIEFQCNADHEGFHGSQHKNALHNLVCVCKQCHCKIHKGDLFIETNQTLQNRTKFIFRDNQQP
jgi:DNA mismatch repair protein MutS